MTNSTISSKNLDSKIKEAVDSLAEYKVDLDHLYEIKQIDYDMYLEILEEMGAIVSTLIMEMRIAHDYKGHTDVLPHGTLHESEET